MNPVCVCGTTKDVVHNIAICQHCDGVICKGPSAGCRECNRYISRVNNRTAVEHAKEKRER